MKNIALLSLITLLGAGCVIAPASQTDPYAGLTALDPEDIGQLYEHHVRFATSADGEDWTLEDGYIAEHASVPDLMTLSHDIGDLKAGMTLSMFVDAEPLEYGLDEEVSYITSVDNGETWSERIRITLDNQDHLPVDPSLVQMDDGTLRLHYYDFSVTRGGSRDDMVSTFYVATSEDGVNFKTQGATWSMEGVMTDPEVVELNGTWYMYYARHSDDDGGIWLVTSEDGLTFENPQKIEVFKGIPGALVHNEEIHLFGCDMGGVVTSSSTDGVNFQELDLSPPVDEFGPGGKVIHDGPTILQTGGLICDPSPTIMKNGEWGLVIKVFENPVEPPQSASDDML
ncbi:MAG: sialidase family protein [bacterium]|nr:sialidase family protein [bacterium]